MTEIRCEACNDTGWYGQDGPGIEGNGSEWMACDQCETGKAQAPIDALMRGYDTEVHELRAAIEERDREIERLKPCEVCGGLGWYGQNGPGVEGHGSEWMACDECRTGEAQAPIVRILEMDAAKIADEQSRRRTEGDELRAEIAALKAEVADARRVNDFTRKVLEHAGFTNLPEALKESKSAETANAELRAVVQTMLDLCEIYRNGMSREAATLAQGIVNCTRGISLTPARAEEANDE